MIVVRSIHHNCGFHKRAVVRLRTRRLILVLTLLLGLPLAMVSAQEAEKAKVEPDLKAQVARLAEPILEQGRSVGISVGVLDLAGKHHTFGFGRVREDDDTVPDQETLFEIGSITKCFTGILLAEMLLRNEVKLQDPAQKYVEDGYRLPLVGGQPITLEELATYSSGLPRMPANFGRSPREHAHYSPQQMLEFLSELAERRQGRGPARHYLYSNLGFALLGHCLAQRAGERIRPLLLSRVVRPLGMESTCFEPGPRLIDRVAKTYGRNGQPVPPWETGAIAPAGMLRSNARDMLRFIAANVEQLDTPLRGAIRYSHLPRYRTGVTEKQPHEHEIGLAWFIDPKTGLVDHDGSTGGSSAYVAFDPKTKVGVVVLMNQNGGPAVGLARQILRFVNRHPQAEYHPRVPRDTEEDDEGKDDDPPARRKRPVE